MTAIWNFFFDHPRFTMLLGFLLYVYLFRKRNKDTKEPVYREFLQSFWGFWLLCFIFLMSMFVKNSITVPEEGFTEDGLMMAMFYFSLHYFYVGFFAIAIIMYLYNLAFAPLLKKELGKPEEETPEPKDNLSDRINDIIEKSKK